MHEHIHAFIHQMLGDKTYKELHENAPRSHPAEEPIVELLCYFTLDYSNFKLHKDIFLKLKRQPPYSEWREILNAPIKIDQDRTMSVKELWNILDSQYERSLHVIFDVFINVLRFCPKDVNDVKNILQDFYPSIVASILEVL